MSKPITEPVLVVAIDFGTTYSGYAFATKVSLDTILTAKHGGKLPEERVPTVILLNPDKTFNSFGYDAMSGYADLSSSDKRKYHYIEFFKMALYNTQHLFRDVKILDIHKKEVQAMVVFTLAIKYLKDLALTVAKETYHGLREDQIQWTITVPAIWTDSARQFMREAAVQAEILPNDLRLVLEPEAASLFCQEQKVQATASKLKKLPVGHKYILADLGGGTADICVHEMMDGGKLRELYRATGGELGGNLVNDAFRSFIAELVGKDVLDEFQSQTMNLYFEMMERFEKVKKTFDMATDKVKIRMEYALLQSLQERNETLKSCIEKSRFRRDLLLKGDTENLFLSKELMRSFFSYTVNGIVEKVKRIMEACANHHIETLMLVGGYAESQYVRECIQSEFTGLNIILQQDTRLAVMKGAVMMGYMPRTIVERRAMFTYGFNYKKQFVKGKHPESLKYIYDNVVWCKDIFDKKIEKNQILEIGKTFTMEGFNTAIDPKQKHSYNYTSLWRSTKQNPTYCRREDGCERVGYIVQRPPAGGWPDHWTFQNCLVVGETEFKVTCLNKTTGEKYEAQMDFLGSDSLF